MGVHEQSPLVLICFCILLYLDIKTGAVRSSLSCCLVSACRHEDVLYMWTLKLNKSYFMSNSCFLSWPLSSVRELTTSAHTSMHTRPYEEHARAALATCSFSKKPSASCGCIISGVPVDRRSGTSAMCQCRLQFLPRLSLFFLKTDTFGETPV